MLPINPKREFMKNHLSAAELASLALQAKRDPVRLGDLSEGVVLVAKIDTFMFEMSRDQCQVKPGRWPIKAGEPLLVQAKPWKIEQGHVTRVKDLVSGMEGALLCGSVEWAFERARVEEELQRKLLSAAGKSDRGVAETIEQWSLEDLKDAWWTLARGWGSIEAKVLVEEWARRGIPAREALSKPEKEKSVSIEAGRDAINRLGEWVKLGLVDWTDAPLKDWGGMWGLRAEEPQARLALSALGQCEWGWVRGRAGLWDEEFQKKAVEGVRLATLLETVAGSKEAKRAAFELGGAEGQKVWMAANKSYRERQKKRKEQKKQDAGWDVAMEIMLDKDNAQGMRALIDGMRGEALWMESSANGSASSVMARAWERGAWACWEELERSGERLEMSEATRWPGLIDGALRTKPPGSEQEGRAMLERARRVILGWGKSQEEARKMMETWIQAARGWTSRGWEPRWGEAWLLEQEAVNPGKPVEGRKPLKL